MRAVTLLLGAVCLLTLAGASGAATPPPGFIDTTVTNNLGRPTAMTWDPASARLFLTLQDGDLKIVKDGVLLGTPFVHLTVDATGERGLLGVVLDPDFPSNHYLYVYYTVPGSAGPPVIPAHNRVSRFTAAGDVAAAGSEQILLELNNLSTATNHNGGALHFGTDGKLYVAVGENNQGSNSQSMNNLLGKLLRMNPDGSIPTDNPFYGTAVGQNRLIWAYGLRNPFTFSIQPGTGRIFINDVGQVSYEEIDEGVAGANYGWPTVDGPSPNPAHTNPIFCYRHTLTLPNCASTTLTGAAITGGDFYNPPVASFPAQYVGRYFFSDYGSNFMATLDPANGNAVTQFLPRTDSPVDIDVGPDGSVYYLDRGGNGRIGRISYIAAPTVTGFSPAGGAAGTQVTIDGTYLAGASSVKFNGLAASFKVVWDTRLVATVPAGATLGQISVTTGAGTAQSADVFGATKVSGFSPTSGLVGTSVTIDGLGFTGATAVKFNGTDAQSYTVDSDAQITAVVAASTTSGTVAVTSPSGTGTSAGSFTVIPPAPTISSFAPVKGLVGAGVVIRGTSFAGASAVRFHGTDAQSYTADSPTQITAVVAAGTTSGQITVTGPGGTGTSVRVFSMTPTITSFTPASGIAGSSVTINGSGFTGAGAVKVNGTGAQRFTVNSDTRITAIVRVGSTSGPITVTGPGGTATSASTFTVTQPPTISSFSPTSGRGGATITILGTRLTGATRVAFHGTNAKSYTVNSDTKITAIVKPGTTSGPIVVTTPVGKATSASSFTVLP